MQTASSDNRPQADSADAPSGVIVLIDGERMALTHEQEALIRSWAAGPV